MKIKNILFTIAFFLIPIISLGASYFQHTALVQQPTVQATAGGTTLLAATANQVQVANGTTTQIYKFPDSTTLFVGTSYRFYNDSTGIVTINDNGNNLITALNPQDMADITLISNPSNAGVWESRLLTPEAYTNINNLVGLGTDFAPEYLNVTRGDARYYTQGQFISSFTGVPSQPVKTNLSGLIDSSIISGGAGLGSVTSVGLSAPVDFTISGTPVTTNGTLAIAYRAATANLVFAGPSSGGNAAPSFRTLVAADLPSLSSTYLQIANNLSDVNSKSTSFNNISPMTTGGDIIYGGASGAGTRLPNGNSGQALLSSGGTAAPAWGNTVSSVGLSLPVDITVSGTPVTTTGTLTGVWRAATANQIFAGPSSGGNATPGFRILATADIPQLPPTQINATLTVTQTTTAPQAISASNIDWSTGSTFTKTLSASTTFTFTNAIYGQVILVRLTNTASNWTVAWPAQVVWGNGNATPTMTTGAHSDVYTFFNDSGVIRGNAVQNY